MATSGLDLSAAHKHKHNHIHACTIPPTHARAHARLPAHPHAHAHTPQALVTGVGKWERTTHGTGTGCTTLHGFWLPGEDAPLAPGGGPFAGGYGTWGLSPWGLQRPKVRVFCMGGAVGEGCTRSGN